MSSKKRIWAFGVVALLPYLLALGYASGHALGLTDGELTFRHYSAILREGRFARSMLYGAAVAGCSVLLSVGGALYIVVVGRGLLRSSWKQVLLYLPLCMPGIVVAFFLLQFINKSGLLSRIAHSVGLINSPSSFPSLVNDALAVGIITAFVIVVLPFFVLLFKSIYDTSSGGELEELALSLGASKWQARWQVSIRLLLYKSKTLLGLYFIFLLGAYEIPLLLGRVHPQMPSVLVIRELQQYDISKMSEGYAVASLYTLAVTLMALIVLRRSNKDYYL